MVRGDQIGLGFKSLGGASCADDVLRYGRRDSNPHEGFPSVVFKTAASAIPPRPPMRGALTPRCARIPLDFAARQ